MKDIIFIIYSTIKGFYRFIIEKIFIKKHEYSNSLIIKISIVFICFSICFALLLLNEQFNLKVNNIVINSNNTKFLNMASVLSKTTIFKLFCSFLGLSLTPNMAQIFTLLICFYFTLIFMILLSFLWRVFILPIIALTGSLFVFYLKAGSNIIMPSYTYLNWYGIKIMHKITDPEKIIYLRELVIKYETSLEDKFIIKGFKFNEENLIDKYKDIYDTDLIRSNFFQELSNYTQEVLSPRTIDGLIDECFKAIPENLLFLVNKNEIIANIKSLELKGDKDIADYIQSYIFNRTDSISVLDIKESLSFIKPIIEFTYHNIYYIVAVIIIVGCSYAIYSSRWNKQKDINNKQNDYTKKVSDDTFNIQTETNENTRVLVNANQDSTETTGKQLVNLSQNRGNDLNSDSTHIDLTTQINNLNIGILQQARNLNNKTKVIDKKVNDLIGDNVNIQNHIKLLEKEITMCNNKYEALYNATKKIVDKVEFLSSLIK